MSSDDLGTPMDDPGTPGGGGAAPPAGWYADPSMPSQQRYWDGAQWTEQTAPGQPASSPSNWPVAGGSAPSNSSDDTLWSVLAHLAIFVLGVIGPLIIWLIKKEESQFIEIEAKEALNFQISIFIYFLISGILTLVIIGLLGFIVFGIMAFVLPIIAAIKASNGEHYRYPLTFRFVK